MQLLIVDSLGVFCTLSFGAWEWHCWLPWQHKPKIYSCSQSLSVTRGVGLRWVLELSNGTRLEVVLLFGRSAIFSSRGRSDRGLSETGIDASYPIYLSGFSLGLHNSAIIG